MTILYFIVGLGLLIFIHELGHFLVAKANGIRVERFSLGFGPRLVKIKWGETEYCISALPLGGYVKMTGQEDFEEGDIVPVDDPKAFSSKSLWARLSVVLAGPGMNLVLPFILMPLVFLLGMEEPKFLNQAPEVTGVKEESPALMAKFQPGDKILKVNGEEVTTWGETLQELAKPPGATVDFEVLRQGEKLSLQTQLAEGQKGMPGFVGIEPMFFFDLDPVVGEVLEGNPAAQAGMKAQDKIIAINDKPIKDWNEMSEVVGASEGQALVFTVLREGQNVNLTIAPRFDNEGERYVIGVQKASNPELYEHREYGLGEAIKKGYEKNIYLFGLTFKVLKDLVTLKASYKDLGGPIRIAQISAKAAQRGLGDFIFLLAFLSIQLGILNLLPIPVLDGGHVLFMAYEGIARKPLSMKKRLVAQQVGMFLLLTLMLVVTVNDIDAVWGFGEILEKIKGLFG